MNEELSVAYEEPAYRTKACPRCGAELFEDMDVCYGCLYDFTRGQDRRGHSGSFPPDLYLEDVVDGSGYGVEVGAGAESSASFVEEPPIPEEDLWPACAHLADPGSTSPLELNRSCLGIGLRVETEDCAFTLPVGSAGLTIGRGEGNDLLLRCQHVSRNHLRVSPLARGAFLEDLGATNPTFVDGMPLLGSEEVPVGTTVDVCGANLTVMEL